MGLTQNTTRQDLARAALEAAYQTRDVMEELKRVAPTHPFRSLRVDGQDARVDFLMQFQADLLNMPVERPVFVEATSLGGAGVAGLAAGFWTQDEFFKVRKVGPHLPTNGRIHTGGPLSRMEESHDHGGPPGG